MRTCKICGMKILDEDEGIVVNENMDNQFYVCVHCVPSECSNGHIISCEACGCYFSADALHDEEIAGHSFTACPSCGRDVVESMTRQEFIDEYRSIRYSVVVHFHSGPRGYIVSVPVGEGTAAVIKKLVAKVDLSGVSEIACSEILLKEDEF